MNITANESVHGHEVMHILQASGPISLTDLSQKVSDKFGSSAVFHTCSANGMNLDGLLQFLLTRGKINNGPNGYYMGQDQHTCDE